MQLGRRASISPHGWSTVLYPAGFLCKLKLPLARNKEALLCSFLTYFLSPFLYMYCQTSVQRVHTNQFINLNWFELTFTSRSVTSSGVSTCHRLTSLSLSYLKACLLQQNRTDDKLDNFLAFLMCEQIRIESLLTRRTHKNWRLEPVLDWRLTPYRPNSVTTDISGTHGTWKRIRYWKIQFCLVITDRAQRVSNL